MGSEGERERKREREREREGERRDKHVLCNLAIIVLISNNKPSLVIF